MYDIVLVEIFVLESLELKMCLFSPLDCLFKCVNLALGRKLLNQ